MSEPKTPQSTSDALRARLAQLELENRLRLQQIQLADGTPAVTDTPRRGFGSAQGIAHLRHTEHQRRGPTPPVPPPPPPPPGRFGGVRLTRPLPGIIESPMSPNEQEVASTLPPIVLDDPRTCTEPPLAPTRSVASKPPVDGRQPAPSGAMPSGRAMPTSSTPKTSPDADAPPAGVPPSPVTAPFDPNKGKVVGGGAVGRKPLPAIYHASVKAAEQSVQEAKGVDPQPSQQVSASGPIVVPRGSEVTAEAEDATKPAPRTKRFKNPTLASFKDEGGGTP